jgi:hypothetical protein
VVPMQQKAKSKSPEKSSGDRFRKSTIRCSTFSESTWDRCYDFQNIFAKKSALLTQNKAKLCEKLIITLVFEKNANFPPNIVKKLRKL